MPDEVALEMRSSHTPRDRHVHIESPIFKKKFIVLGASDKTLKTVVSEGPPSGLQNEDSEEAVYKSSQHAINTILLMPSRLR